jgi:hypothetical protein
MYTYIYIYTRYPSIQHMAPYLDSSKAVKVPYLYYSCSFLDGGAVRTPKNCTFPRKFFARPFPRKIFWREKFNGREVTVPLYDTPLLASGVARLGVRGFTPSVHFFHGWPLRDEIAHTTVETCIASCDYSTE